MAYCECILEDGIIQRKYFGLDSSGIMKMYYNGKIVRFPKKELIMGKGNTVEIAINMSKFNKMF